MKLFFKLIISIVLATGLITEARAKVFGYYVFPLNQYESAFINQRSGFGLQVIDYYSVVSGNYSYSDSGNFKIKFTLGTGAVYPSFSKTLFSVWDKPVNLQVSGGILFAGYFYDVKLVSGVFKNEQTNVSVSLTKGPFNTLTWDDADYYSIDFIVSLNKWNKNGMGLGFGLNRVSDEIGKFDIESKNIISKKIRNQYSFQIGVFYNF